jgi:hypothetical protein
LALKSEVKMSQKKFPIGWNQNKVQQVLAHYGQTDDEAAAEDETILRLEQLGALPAEELENIRWRLVQKSWNGPLPPSEQLQLRLVEARIDAADRVQNTAFWVKNPGCISGRKRFFPRWSS